MKGAFYGQCIYKTKQVDERGKDIYKDIRYPVTREFRETLFKAIIDEYDNRKGRLEEDFAEYIEQQEGQFEKSRASQARDDSSDIGEFIDISEELPFR